MLLRLFPSAALASVEQQRRHLTRLICGAFTNGQATSAAKAFGFDPSQSGRSTLRQLRLPCLEHIDIDKVRKEAARV